MTPPQVVLLVLGILVSLALIWIPVGIWLSRRAKARTAALLAELAASGEKVLRGPEAGNYKGATESYPQVKGNGQLVLTDRRLIVRRLVGAPFDIPTADIVGVRESPAFLGSRAAGLNHAILALRGGAEAGFYFRDHRAWMDALAALAARNAAHP